MTNVEIKEEGNKIIIIVDKTKTFGRSTSGKTVIVASTQGNVAVGDVWVGLNVYRKDK